MSDQELTRNDENAEFINTDNEVHFVGLKNQGATCYMNSLLQALFHLPAFRRIVYKMPTTGNEDVSKSIPLNLQRLFAMMQFSDLPCSTKSLTKSFGWGDDETFMQHDLQEFSRVLIDNLETKLKGDPELKDSISNILKGQYVSFIRCKDVNYKSSRDEDFYDLTLQVKGCSDLQESFQKYIQKEQLVGNNQYKTDEYGLQDAEMGVEFTKFPSVLHLHLSRFEYDAETDQMTKINDKFEFPESIDLAPFLSPDSDHSQSLVYDLYGVLVHMGNVFSGHYYAFLRTSTDPQWYKFDDNVVTKVDSKDAIEDNFGETQSSSRNGSYYKTNNYNYGYGINNYGYNNYYNNFGKRYSAYMLVYIRRADANRIMAPVTLTDIPRHLQQYAKTQIQMKKRNSEIKNDRRSNHFLVVLRDEDLKSNSLMGIDIYNPPFLNSENIDIFNQHQLHPDSPIYLNGEELDQNNYRYDLLSNLIFKIGHDKTLGDLYRMVSKRFDVPINEVRIWHQENVQNRLRIVNNYDNQFIEKRSVPSTILFYQHKDAEDVVSMSNDERFIFVKYFFPTASLPIQFIHSYVVKTSMKFPDFCNKVNEELGIKLEKDDKMLVYRQYNDSNTGEPMKVDIIPNSFTMSDVPSGVFIYLQIDPTLDIDEYYKWSQNNQTFDPTSADYDEKLRNLYLNGDDHKKQKIDEIREKMIEKRDRVYSIHPSKFKLEDPIPVKSFIINENKANEPSTPKDKTTILKESEIFPKTAMLYPFFILEKYNKVEIDIYSYDHQEKPIFTIETFKYSTVQKLKKIIAFGIHENYNPKQNAIILYVVKDRNFYYQSNANDKLNVSAGNDDDENDNSIGLTVYEFYSHQDPKISDLFTGLDMHSMNKNYRLYFLMMKNVDESQAMFLHQYTVQFSLDGVNIQQELKILDNSNITLRKLYDKIKSKIPQIAQIEAQYLSQKKDNDDDYDYDDDSQIEQIFRFYSIYNHLYSKKLSLATFLDYYSDNIRIDLIPEEQKHLKDDETLIQVTYIHMKEYEGNPFFVVFKKGEPFSEVKKRILKCVPDKNEVINFSIRQKYNSYANYYRQELKDDMIVSDYYNNSSNRIYVNLKNKRSESSSIKIYN